MFLVVLTSFLLFLSVWHSLAHISIEWTFFLIFPLWIVEELFLLHVDLRLVHLAILRLRLCSRVKATPITEASLNAGIAEFPKGRLCLLNEVINQTDFSVFSDSDASMSWDDLTSYLNFRFSLYSPIETLHIRPDCFSAWRLPLSSVYSLPLFLSWVIISATDNSSPVKKPLLSLLLPLT